MARRGTDATGWTDTISDAERQQHQRTVQDLTGKLDFQKKRVAYLEAQVPRDPDGALRARVGELERERDLARSAHRAVSDTLARLRHSIRGFARQHAP